MDYTLEFLPEKGYVWARVSGSAVLEVARKCAAETFALAAGRDCMKILLDNRQAVIDTPLSGIHKFLSQIEQAGCDRRMSVAIVARDAPVKHHFLETVARNHGFDFRVFTELADAEIWLACESVVSV